MPRDGSGNYSRVHNWVTDLGNGINIIASRMDAEDDSIATAMTNSLDRSAAGGGAILRDVSMANNKFTSIGSGAALTDSINYDDVQSGTILFFGTTGGTSTVYTLSPSPSIDAYDTGMEFLFKVNADSGTDPTLNISAKGAKNLKKYIGSTKTNIQENELKTGVFYSGVYDGTDIVVNLQKTLVTSTIVTGAITYTSVDTILNGEGAAADNLDTITGGIEGDIIILKKGDSNITIRDNGVSGGNIDLIDNRNILLKFVVDTLTLMKRGSDWFEQGGRTDADFNQTDAINGHQYLPSNYLEQWGFESAIAGSSTRVVNLPITYDTIRNGMVSVEGTTIAVVGSVLIDLTSTSQVSLYNDYVNPIDAFWKSIGYHQQT